MRATRLQLGLGLGALVVGVVLVGVLLRGPGSPSERPSPGRAAAVRPPPAPRPSRLLPPPPETPPKPIELPAAMAQLAEPARSGGIDHALKDAVMETLHRPDVPAAEAAEGLLALFEDRAGDVVVRDYALQHLRLVYERLAGEEAGGDLRKRILAAYEAALRETGSAIPGTALLSLNGLADAVPGEVPDELVRDRAVALLADAAACDRARLTACAVAARRSDPRALPLARALAADARASMPLRIAAIAALGDLGGEEVLPELDRWQEDPHFEAAARRARIRIQERKGTP